MMQLLTDDIQRAMGSSSFIRKMFEKGLELKRQFGEDAVCDFSLGNPDVPPPIEAKRELEKLAESSVRPLGLGYCPNAGIPAVREAMAGYITKQQNLAVKGFRELLLQGKTNRIVCTRDGSYTDVDISEGLAMRKSIQQMEVDVLAAMTGI